MHTPRSANTRDLVAACAAITVFGFAFGMTCPLPAHSLRALAFNDDPVHDPAIAVDTVDRHVILERSEARRNVIVLQRRQVPDRFRNLTQQ